MIYGVGTDICENRRIGSLLEKYNNKFLDRVYTPEEIDYCMAKKNPVPHLAARFAMKEAFIKALNLESGNYNEIGLAGNRGKKEPVVSERIRKILHQHAIENIQCSISHAVEYSTAVVILERAGS